MKLSTPIKTDDGEISEGCPRSTGRRPPGRHPPGFFGEFTIIGGKLPDGVSSLTFKAVQTYSDGTQVARIEQPAPVATPRSNTRAGLTLPLRRHRKPIVERTVGERDRHYAGIVEFRGEQDGCHDRNHSRRCRCGSRRRSLCSPLSEAAAPTAHDGNLRHMDDRRVRPG
jgi:hypothetical protein